MPYKSEWLQEALVFDLAGDGEIVRIWSFFEAPLEFQQALAEEQIGERWLAHIPAALLEEPLVALLTSNTSSKPLKTKFLADGSKLVSGELSASDWQDPAHQNEISQATVHSRVSSRNERARDGTERL